MDLDYNELIEKAMRNVVKFALKKAQKIKDRNLCFLFVVNTKNKHVVLPNYIKKQYPKEITLVLQHQFSNLNVKNSSFSVDLSFNGKIENVVIPFSSLIAFLDQVMGIELRFNFGEDDDLFFSDDDECDDDLFFSDDGEANNNADIRNNVIDFIDFKNRKIK
ncbi:MAG: ClpXP protease specificity-enhancing factor SspB [Rickettsiales bacterium]|jgi:hypothetical protein|nr:ClpXP protease specificity-enhancing factor SspB [Rickettsiales bacterium]